MLETFLELFLDILSQPNAFSKLVLACIYFRSQPWILKMDAPRDRRVLFSSLIFTASKGMHHCFQRVSCHRDIDLYFEFATD